MDVLAAYVGIYYPPALLFLLLILTLVLVLIQFSIVISKQSEQITKLAQEIALLKYKKRRKRKNKKTIEPIPNTSGEPPCNEDLT